jgi:hypothetical protein
VQRQFISFKKQIPFPMINVLFVSIAFPPKSDPECIQTAKYYYHLQAQPGLKIEVLTSALPTLYMSYDAQLEKFAVGARNIVELPLKENRWLNFLRNRLGLSETVFPDTKQSFHKQAAKAVKQLKQSPHVIYSRSYPLSSTLMAYKLKKKFNVPWVLHLSDPWASSPIHNFSKKYQEKYSYWERKCFEAADRICLTSLSTVRFYTKRYPEMAEKFLHYPNVFELTLSTKNLIHPSLSFGRKLKMVYTGGLTSKRSPKFLLEPLKQLYADNPEIGNLIEVVFAGETDYQNRDVFKKYKLPFVKHIGKISYPEALRLQRKADLLLSLDYQIEDPDMAMFFPSKLLDYMLAKHRILAITTPGSATSEVMSDLKGDVYAHNDIESIKTGLLNAIKAFINNDVEYFQNEHLPEKYRARYNAQRLAVLFKHLVSGNKAMVDTKVPTGAF